MATGPRKGKMKSSPKAKTIANANMIVPIQTYEDTNERLRRNVDPKRYANPDSKDGKWPRRVKYGKV
tara:strand:+ start:1632 stop:1832 length:201 start_codon:yes stop_codon:yes gene_type:complete